MLKVLVNKSCLSVFFVYVIVFLSYSCETKSNEKAIRFYTEKIEKDSLTLYSLISYSADLAEDSINTEFTISEKYETVDIAKRSISGELIDGVVVDSEVFKKTLYKQFMISGITTLVYHEKMYIGFETVYRNMRLRYYQLIYSENEIIDYFINKGYKLYEHNSYPEEASKWIYKVKDKWYVLSP